MNNYYTYCYLSVTKRPYYVGMGCEDRAYRTHNQLDVCMPDDRELIIMLKSGLTQEEAWKHEKYMIAVLGRQCDGGMLINRARGGSGWGGGTPCTEQRKSRIGKANKGRKMSLAHRKAISDRQRGKKQKPEAVANRARACRREITLLSPDGEAVTFSSHTEASRHIGAHYTCLTRLKSGRLKTVKGWSLTSRN